MINFEAKKDYQSYLKDSSDDYLNYEIKQKIISSDDYKKCLINEIKEHHRKESLPIPIDNYTNSKINHFISIDKNYSENKLNDFQSKFENKYPNGFLKSLENSNQFKNNSKDMNDSEYNYENLSKAIDEFIRGEKANENQGMKNTQYMLDYMSKHPYEFNAFSERFFSEGFSNKHNLSEKILNKYNPSDIKKLSDKLNKNIITKAKQYIKTVKDIKLVSNLSDTLKNYRQNQFKEELAETKKLQSLKMENSQKLSKTQGIKI